MSRKAYVGFGAKRTSDLAENVFGAKRFWALPRTGCRTTEVVIGAIYTVGRQTNGGGVCRGWWRCVMG